MGATGWDFDTTSPRPVDGQRPRHRRPRGRPVGGSAAPDPTVEDGAAVVTTLLPVPPGGDTTRPAVLPPSADAAPDTPAPDARTPHERVQADPEFAELRRRQRRFVFPVTAAFLLWYLAYVLLACYARDLMAVPVADGINLGLVIGLLQFVSTFAISTAYVVYARHRLDPLAEDLRGRVERAGDVPAVPAEPRLFDDADDAR